MTAPTPREELVAELVRLRRLAGQSGRTLAPTVGVSQSTLSRIEAGQQVPSLPQVKKWAVATEASADDLERLIALTKAAHNTIAGNYERLTEPGGIVGMQVDVATLEGSAHTVRIFQPTMIPGLLQTAEYARRVMTIADITGRADITAGVAARVGRQRVLYDEGKRFEFLLTDGSLRFLSRPPNLVAAQVDRLVSISSLSNVELGIVPAGTQLPVLPWGGFNLYDDHEGGVQPIVTMETGQAWVTCTDPDDLAIYRKQLDLLREVAVFGDQALAEIRRVVQE